MIWTLSRLTLLAMIGALLVLESVQELQSISLPNCPKKAQQKCQAHCAKTPGMRGKAVANLAKGTFSCKCLPDFANVQECLTIRIPIMNHHEHKADCRECCAKFRFEAKTTDSKCVCKGMERHKKRMTSPTRE